MRFLLEPGDAVLADPCRPDELRAGELALLVEWRGGRPAGYCVHRVIARAGSFVLTKGDANFLPDLPPGAFVPAGRVAAAERGGVSWSARPGPAWPLVCAYSLAAGKALSWTARAAYFSFSAAGRCLPAALGPALDAAALEWERSLYPRLAALAAGPLRPARTGPSGRVKSGRITSDETWSGPVVVTDYLTIERGASVRVLPGTSITFSRAGSWFLPVARSGSGGPRELDSALAKILVYGKLEALGSPEAPVVFAGPSFGGVHALGGGEAAFRGCAFSGAGGSALSAWDHSFLLAEDCVFEGCARGAELLGSAAGSLKRCRFSRLAGPAVRALDGSSLTLLSASASGGEGPALELSGAARADIRDFSAAGTARGASVSGRAGVDAAALSFGECSGGALLVSGSARFSVSGLSVEGGGFGLAAADGASVRLGSASVRGAAGPAASLSGGASLSAGNCSFSDNAAGITLKGSASAVLKDCAVSGSRGPCVKLTGSGGLSLEGCLLEGGAAGVEAAGRASVSLVDCSFKGLRGAAITLDRVSRASAVRASFENCSAGISLSGNGPFRGADLVFSGLSGPALKADSGRVRLRGSSVRNSGAGVQLSGSADASLSACSFGPLEEAGAAVSGRARLRLEACSFSACGSGIKAGQRADALADNCSFYGMTGAGAELAGEAGLAVSGCTFDACVNAAALGGSSFLSFRRVDAGAEEAAVSLEGRSAFCAVSSALRSSGYAVYAAAGAAFDAQSCGLSSSGEAGLFLAGASASLSGCSLSGGRGAVHASGAAGLRADGCALSSPAAAALILDGGKAALSGCSLAGRAGAAAAGGTSLRLADCAVSAVESGVVAAGRFGARRLWVTGGRLGGVLLSGPAAAIDGAEISGAPYPGLAAAPGTRVIARGVNVDGRPWPRPARPPRAALRRALFRFAAATSDKAPFAGLYRALYRAAAAAAGPLLGLPGVRAVYLYRGMAGRSWVAGLSDMDLACVTDELTPERDRLLYGALARRLRALRAVFPFTGEALIAPGAAFSAFTRGWGVKAAEFPAASRLLAGTDPPPAAVRRLAQADRTEAFYAYTLLMRHFFDGGLPENFRRRNCLKGLADILRYLAPETAPGRESREAFAAAAGLPLRDYMSAPAEEYAWRAFAALHAAAGSRPAGGTPAPLPGSGWFNSAAFEAARERLSAGCGGGAALALDSLYRVYLILPDGTAADRGAFLRACSALAGERASSAALGASPLVLTRGAFSLLCGLPYLNNPLFAADLAAGRGGRRPEDGGVFCSGPVPVPALSCDGAAAAAAAVHFAASWRSLWGEMPPHYFYTRAGGLRLLRAGARPAGLSDPLAVETALRAAGIRSPGWEDFLAGGAGAANYEWTAAMTAAEDAGA